MAVTGGSPSPASFAGADTPGTSITLNAGSYAVSETGPSGYASSFSADCTGTIALGQTKTCTVTNNDQPGQLIVDQQSIEDDGGTATASNFTMSVTGSNPSPGGFPGAESPGTQVGLNVGSYSVSESGPSGYASNFSADCTGTIALGQTKTCTVTNNDQQGTLIVKKVVVNRWGGTEIATNFSFQVNGGSATPFVQNGINTLGKNTLTVNAGVYNITELPTTSYATSYTDCQNVSIRNGD